jgi:predicted O-linked N-acetylglucosamine transferase (SPINDLY family)
MIEQAVASYASGNLVRAERLCKEILTSQPECFEALSLLGVMAQQAGELESAVGWFARAVIERQHYAPIVESHGMVLRQLRRFDEALASYSRLIELRPDDAGAHLKRGLVLQELRRPAEALASYERALRLNPSSAEAWNNRGIVLWKLGAGAEALQSYDRALQLVPDLAAVHNNRGNVLRASWRFEEALRSYDRALELQPGFALAHHGRGIALEGLGRQAEARDSYERALRLNIDIAWLRGDWLMTKMHLCDWSDVDTQIAQLCADVAQGKQTVSAARLIAFCDSPVLQRQAAQTWVNETCPPRPTLSALAARARRSRIRLGYYSSDYGNHPVAYLAAGLFEAHDREQFEVVAFSSGPPRSDEMASRLATAFDQFVDVRSRSDREVAQLSRDMGIDIAVDLMGFTGNARTGIFAERAAPIQVSYLGYPGTMGAPYIDYLIADTTVIPRTSHAHYTEKIVYLPHSFLPYDRKRQISQRELSRDELGLPLTAFVFCCFNNVYKITPAIFGCWMRILRSVDGSVLWLGVSNEVARANLCREAAARGVTPERLVFAARLPRGEDHLARHRAADLFLDTFPYNAHSTASDALWAGLPVVTRTGESFATRVAASLLHAVGLPELVTETVEAYEALAIELARDRVRYARLRQTLDQNRLQAPLFDTSLYTGNLERAFRVMYEGYLAGGSRDSFEVPA